MTQQAESAPNLVSLLNQHQVEIAAAWAEMVQQLPDSHYCERPLEELRASTMRGLGTIIEALDTGSHTAMETYLIDVSLTRLRMGFDISEVIEALLLCSDAALPTIWKAYPPGSREARAAIARLDVCLRHMVGRFGRLHADAMRNSLEEQQRRTALMLETAQAASSSLELNEVLHLVTDSMAAAVGVRHCGIYLMDDESGRLFPTAGRADPQSLGPGFDQAYQSRPLDPARDAFICQVLEGQEPVVCYDAQTDPRTDREMAQLLGLKSVLAVPFVAKDRVVAVAMVSTFDDHYHFTPEQIELARGIASAAAVAIENARLYEQAQQAATVEERQRLARELHDAVTQTLFSASLIAEVLPRLWEHNPEEGRRRLAELRELTRGALAEMRTLLLELRPAALTETSLGDLLRQLGEAITGRARVAVSVTVEGECSLPADVQVALYRIAQEALNNVAKHAGASQTTVNLSCEEDEVALRISDDGRGFDPVDISPDHLGLGIMRERAQAIGAMVDIESRPGQGTNVTVIWPGTSGD